MQMLWPNIKSLPIKIFNTNTTFHILNVLTYKYINVFCLQSNDFYFRANVIYLSFKFPSFEQRDVGNIDWSNRE